LETAVFRIVQEALNNMFRHSGARQGWVSLKQRDSQLIVTVRDNGKGIDASVVECRPNSIGVGIGGMRQRVTEFGGELHLENCNPGTLIEFSIPTGSLACQKLSAAPVLKDKPFAKTPAGPVQPISVTLATPAASTGTVAPVSISSAVSKDAADSLAAACPPV
jgi:hypothetical protein